MPRLFLRISSVIYLSIGNALLVIAMKVAFNLAAPMMPSARS